MCVPRRFRMAAIRVASILSGVAWSLQAVAQNDISAVALMAPASGCALTSAEVVTLRLFNYGATLGAGSSFNASYAINAGAPVTELVVLGAPLLANSTLTYTFGTPADLSVPGAYAIDASVALAGDVNPTNDAIFGVEVENSAPSVGGAVSGPGTPVLSGSASLTGQIGDVVEWQQSTDGGRRWRRLANTTTTQDFANLRQDTAFRALVKSGACAPALSSAFTVTSSDPIFHSGFEP
jgi:hypothetical protein